MLEICCYSADDVYHAAEGGAHRVELCSGYAVGGTTPSLGVLQLAKTIVNIPIYVMIRPRGGNFTYSQNEKKVMLKDAALCIENNADGIVFGALNQDGTLDEEFCKQMKGLCAGLPITFHRAIDLCANPKYALAFLSDLGVQTILTSGAESTALQGIEQIKTWHEMANASLQIMAGAGVNSDNILQFAKMGLTHFHSSASHIIGHGNMNDKIAFNASLKNHEISVVSKAKVEAMVEQLNSFFISRC